MLPSSGHMSCKDRLFLANKENKIRDRKIYFCNKLIFNYFKIVQRVYYTCALSEPYL